MNTKFVFCLLLFMMFSGVTLCLAQEDEEMFDPLNEIKGELVFVGELSIGKTKGQNNYVEVSVNEFVSLNSGSRRYYILLSASGVSRISTVYDSRTKYLTVEEAESLKNAFLALKPVNKNSGDLKGALAYYSVDDDLSIAKHFNSKLYANQDRGIVVVGFRPYTTTAALNINDFNSVDALLQKAINMVNNKLSSSGE